MLLLTVVASYNTFSTSAFFSETITLSLPIIDNRKITRSLNGILLLPAHETIKCQSHYPPQWFFKESTLLPPNVQVISNRNESQYYLKILSTAHFESAGIYTCMGQTRAGGEFYAEIELLLARMFSRYNFTMYSNQQQILYPLTKLLSH